MLPSKSAIDVISEFSSTPPFSVSIFSISIFLVLVLHSLIFQDENSVSLILSSCNFVSVTLSSFSTNVQFVCATNEAENSSPFEPFSAPVGTLEQLEMLKLSALPLKFLSISISRRKYFCPFLLSSNFRSSTSFFFTRRRLFGLLFIVFFSARCVSQGSSGEEGELSMFYGENRPSDHTTFPSGRLYKRRRKHGTKVNFNHHPERKKGQLINNLLD